jgi:hypothetical protein
MGDLTMINSHQVKGKNLNCNVYWHVMGAVVLDVLLMWGAYRSTRHHIVMRMLIRLVWFGAVSGGVIFLYV